MSTSTVLARREYAGDGSSVLFTIPFKIFATTDLKVYQRVNLTGVETLVDPADYTIPNGSLGSEVSALIMDTAPAVGVTLVLVADPSQVQSLTLPPNGPFPAKEVEFNFDKITRMIHHLSDLASRAISLSKAFPSTFNPALPTVLEPGKTLAVNEDGNGFEMGPSLQDILDAAGSAAGSAQDAQDAKDAAQAAQSAADTAQAAAESAQTSAEAAAVSAADSASAAQDAAAAAGAQTGSFNVTANQSAANVLGETLDSTVYSSSSYIAEVKRGSDIVSVFEFGARWFAGAWVIDIKSWIGAAPDLTFSFSGNNLQVAETGGTNASFKLKKGRFTI